MRNELPWFRDLRRKDRRSRDNRHLPSGWEVCEVRTLLSFTIFGTTIEGPKPGQPQAFAKFLVLSTPPDIEHTLSVDYTTSDGTALSGKDYVATSGTVIISPDDGSQTITVPINSVLRDSVNQSFFVTLSNPQGTTIAVGQATGTIHTTPSLTIDNATVLQPSSGTATTVFTVGLFPVSPVPVTVQYATSDGTALAGRDYLPTQGTLTFAPGETLKPVDVSVLGGTLNISDRTFHLDLANPIASTILSPGYGVGTIVDTHPAGVLNFASATYSADEDSGSALITVTRTSGIAGGVSVDYSTTNTGSATAGENYLPTSGTLHFDVGQTSKSFLVPVIDNLVVENNRSVSLALSNPQGGASLSPLATATLVVANIDTLTVTNTLLSGRGSFTKSLLSANATPGFSTVRFALPDSTPSTFLLTQPLPSLTKPGAIDATTQTGYTGTPLVVLDGSQLGPNQNGLNIKVGSSIVRGLAIRDFTGSGIFVQGPGGNRVEFNEIGPGNQLDGVTILNSSGNMIATNLLAANGHFGLSIEGLSASSNVVQRNMIGTNHAGNQGVGNGSGGVSVDNAPGNLIGGSTNSQRNLISGNSGPGIQIRGAGAIGNSIYGNWIGVDQSGNQPLGNAGDGIFLNQASQTLIGGADNSANLISANGLSGVRIEAGHGNLVQNNRIGTNDQGTLGLGVQIDGVYILNSANNAVSANLVSGNTEVGVQVHGPLATNNVIDSNRVGTDLTGMKPIGNGLDGIFINDAPSNTIHNNLIAGNGSAGLQLLDTGSQGNVVSGNLIGTNVVGKVQKSLGNLIGLFLNVVGKGNSISGNTGPDRNLVAGNRRTNRLTNTLRNPAFVVAVDATPNQGHLARIIVSFNRSLDASTAANLNNFQLSTTGGVALPTFATAIYDDLARTITLTLTSPLTLSTPLVLTVSGLRDRSGHPIDGRRTGLPGGHYVTTIGASAVHSHLLGRGTRR